LAEIGLVHRANVLPYVENDEADQPDLQDRFGPVLHEFGEARGRRPWKQARPIGIAFFGIFGDRRGIVDHFAAIDDYRQATVSGRRQLALFGKAPWYRLDLESLVSQRHPGAPAEWAEPPVWIGPGEIVHCYGHSRPGCVFAAHYGPSRPS